MTGAADIIERELIVRLGRILPERISADCYDGGKKKRELAKDNAA